MIRRLQPWEIEDCLPLAEKFLASSNEPAVFSPQAMHNFFATNKWLAVGMFVEDKLVGVLIAFIAPHFVSTDILCQEIMWYVEPEHRGSPECIRMADVFEEWGLAHGATAFAMVALPYSPPAAIKLYERKGYHNVGTTHLKFIR